MKGIQAERLAFKTVFFTKASAFLRAMKVSWLGYIWKMFRSFFLLKTALLQSLLYQILLDHFNEEIGIWSENFLIEFSPVVKRGSF